MEKNRRIKESSLYQSNFSQSDFYKRRFPLLSSVEKLHERNIKTISACKNNSLHSGNAYEALKDQYRKDNIQYNQMHVENAIGLSKERKKLLEEKRKSKEKRREENFSKFEKIMAEKKNEVALKQKKLMERSELIRQDFLKSLNNSFHKSQDRLSHIKELQKKQYVRSAVLFSEHKTKINAANDRKNHYLSQLKVFFREKNELVTQAQQDWSKKNRAVQEGYIQQLVSKLYKAEKSQKQRNTKMDRQLKQKRKDEDKLQEKYLKKRCMLQENRERKRQQQARKSEEKIDKAIEFKTAKLATITNTMENKRKQKELEVKQALHSSWRQQEAKVIYLNEKHQHSSQMLHAYRSQLQKLHRDNLAESFIASNQ